MSAYLTLCHATPNKNVESIEKKGLLRSKSKGRLRVVWLHARSKSEWAILHVVGRHGGKAEDVVVYDVCVPRENLRRSHRRGLWYYVTDVEPRQFRGVKTFGDFAEHTGAK